MAPCLPEYIAIPRSGDGEPEYIAEMDKRWRRAENILSWAIYHPHSGLSAVRRLRVLGGWGLHEEGLSKVTGPGQGLYTQATTESRAYQL